MLRRLLLVLVVVTAGLFYYRAEFSPDDLSGVLVIPSGAVRRAGSR
jgi:hypothetical protein